MNTTDVSLGRVRLRRTLTFSSKAACAEEKWVRPVLRSTTAESGDVIRDATAEGGRSLTLPGFGWGFAALGNIRAKITQV
jgi:hypothetical protein